MPRKESFPADPRFINKMITRVTEVISTATKLFQDEEGWGNRKGGYFCIADGTTGIPVVTVQVGGIVSIEKAIKYLSLCQEKALRLSQHPDHISSWQSRDPDKNQWGGAIRYGVWIISLSGFPDDGDEAIMTNSIDEFDENGIIEKVTAASNNTLIPRLKSHLSG